MEGKRMKRAGAPEGKEKEKTGSEENKMKAKQDGRAGREEICERGVEKDRDKTRKKI